MTYPEIQGGKLCCKMAKKKFENYRDRNLCKYSVIIMIERTTAVMQGLKPNRFLQYYKLIGI